MVTLGQHSLTLKRWFHCTILILLISMFCVISFIWLFSMVAPNQMIEVSLRYLAIVSQLRLNLKVRILIAILIYIRTTFFVVASVSTCSGIITGLWFWAFYLKINLFVLTRSWRLIKYVASSVINVKMSGRLYKWFIFTVDESVLQDGFCGLKQFFVYLRQFISFIS
jgi:hypothetical protein